MYYDLLVQLRRCAEGRCRGCPRSHAEGCRKSVSTEAANAIEEQQNLNCELLFRVGQAEALIDYYQTGRMISNAPPEEE